MGEIAAADRQPVAAVAPTPIAGVVRYLEDHFTEPCTLGKLAIMAGLSRFHFARRFRAATGISPHQYLISLRLRAAAERLHSSGDSITMIALEVGFNDLSHFNLLFRRSFGVTPSRWRILGRHAHVSASGLAGASPRRDHPMSADTFARPSGA